MEGGMRWVVLVIRLPAGPSRHRVAKEQRLGKLTLAELEEEEHSLERLRRWWRDLKARDAFALPEASDAEQHLKRCEQLLDAFAEPVYRAVHQPLGESADDACPADRPDDPPRADGGRLGAAAPAVPAIAARAAAGAGPVHPRLRDHRPPSAAGPASTPSRKDRDRARRPVAGFPDRPHPGVPAGDRSAGRRRCGRPGVAVRRPAGPPPGAPGGLAG